MVCSMLIFTSRVGGLSSAIEPRDICHANVYLAIVLTIAKSVDATCHRCDDGLMARFIPIHGSPEHRDSHSAVIGDQRAYARRRSREFVALQRGDA